jgi:hypothetical protein
MDAEKASVTALMAAFFRADHHKSTQGGALTSGLDVGDDV